jgi:hypothetical protein
LTLTPARIATGEERVEQRRNEPMTANPSTKPKNS